ncbi:MAG TPA: TetR/AcrR family transcriptional regulator [Microbacteriaceae bacterium]|nr:TetR/AcrR family transcriptional regulator [Microbacteriaceae bacterium]
MPQIDPATSRTRRPRSSLTVEGILDAAELVAAQGFETLTIRAVATELEASPMALYRYFTTKDELVDALLNRVLGRFAVSSETEDWLADLRNFALDHRRLLHEHPWAIAPLTQHPNPGPNALPIGEAALHILKRAGIIGDDAVATFSGLIALNYGWASFVVGKERADELEDNQTTAQPLTVPGAYPLTGGVAEAMSRYGSHKHYDVVLNQLLAGIDANR